MSRHPGPIAAACTALLAATLLVPAGGCARRQRAAMEIAGRRLSVEIPVGWRHVNLGKRQVLRRGEAQIAFEALVPAGRDRIRREVENARGLARDGRLPAAREALSAIPVPDDLFPTAGRRDAFFDTWSQVTDAREGAPAHEVDAAFGRLLDAIASLPDRDSALVERESLQKMGADERIDVASRVRVRVNGCDAVVIETWLRLTHEVRGRHAIVNVGGATIALWTERGALADTGPAFESVLFSLRLEGDGVVDSAGVRGARRPG